jgi:5-hydroxyisourate hydrolase-like protein (transthyretin family)
MLLLCAISIISGCGPAPTLTPALRQQSLSHETAHPFHGTLETLDGAFTVTLDVTPNRSGTNVFMIRVVDNRTGKPAVHVYITLYTTMQDMAMCTDSIVLHADGKGQYSATSDNLSMVGHWAIGVAIQTADHTIHKVGVSLVTSP